MSKNTQSSCIKCAADVIDDNVVNGKTEILTPCRSEIPENIEFGVNDYVMDPYNLANFCGNRS